MRRTRRTPGAAQDRGAAPLRPPLPALLFACLCGVGVAAVPASPARAQATGAAAFAARDYGRAARLWRREAAAGSARARLGLGRINDLGLGTPRDAAKALRWYLAAAGAGLADAQFNAGVMLDSGVGGMRDTGAAAAWYSRAAAQGHARAQYNLGLLFESGEGVARNHRLARYWYRQARTSLSAATERLAGLDPRADTASADTAPGPGRPAPPALLAADVVAIPAHRGPGAPSPAQRAGAAVAPAATKTPSDIPASTPGSVSAPIRPPDRSGARHRAEIAWTARPGRAGSHFLVEIVLLPRAAGGFGRSLIARHTSASAIAVAIPASPTGYAARVSRLSADGTQYAATPWKALGAAVDRDGAGARLPEGRVHLRIHEGDANARRLARILAASLAPARIWTRIETAPRPLGSSRVQFAYRDDSGLAADVADLLPALDGDAITRAPGANLAPGEIRAFLVGGPAPGPGD